MGGLPCKDSEGRRDPKVNTSESAPIVGCNYLSGKHGDLDVRTDLNQTEPATGLASDSVSPPRMQNQCCPSLKMLPVGTLRAGLSCGVSNLENRHYQL